MPNRIIKESIRTSKTVNGMSDFQFRLWVYLITYVDDYGRGSADPELLKGFVFPRRKRVTESDIERALAELADIGCIHLYTVDGEPYLCFPNWGEHQRIQNKRSKYPSPDAGELHKPAGEKGVSRKSTVGHGGSPPESESESNPKGGGLYAPAREETAYTQAMQAFVAMREQCGRPMGREAVVILQAKLEQMAPGDREKQMEIVRQSVVKGWMDVYPLGSKREKGERHEEDAAAKYGQRGTVL